MASPDVSGATAETDSRPKPVVVVVSDLVGDPEERRGSVIWAVTVTTLLGSALLLLRYLPTVGWPLVLAAIGAYLLDPVVNWSHRRGVPRWLSSAIFIGLGCLFVVGAMVSLLPKAVQQIANVPAHFRSAIDIILGKFALLGDKAIPEDFEQLLVLAREHVPDILTRVLPGASTVLTTVLGQSLSALSFVLGSLVVPVVGYYLLKGWPDIIRGTVTLVPAKLRPHFLSRMKEIDRVLQGFIRGQLTMALVLSGLYTVGLTAVGLKLSVVVGLMTGIGNLVPYVGTASGLTLAIASCLVDFGIDYHLALVVTMFLTIMTADSMFITPRIVGNKVGLSPAAVIVAVLACGSLFGFGGVLLAVPSVAILKVVMRVLVAAYKNSDLYRAG